MAVQRVGVALLVVLGLSLAGWLAFSERAAPPARRGEDAAERAARPDEARSDEAHSDSNQAHGDPSTAPVTQGTPNGADPSAPERVALEASAAPAPSGPRRDRQRADELRELLAAMYAGRLAAEQAEDDVSNEPPRHMPSPEGEGNQASKPLGEYVGRMMREQFTPLAGDCFEQLLARSPRAEGRIDLEFSIMGDASVGGVVVDVAFGEGTNLKEPEFTTCIRESMFAVVFDAPPAGSPTLTVTQSLEFSP